MPLSRRTSVQAQEVIRRAYKELESAVSASDALVFNKTTIEDVQKACRILENELGARGLLRNMGRLEPLLKGLECYGKVVDTLCQGTPFLPWIWAPIVTILKVSVSAAYNIATWLACRTVSICTKLSTKVPLAIYGGFLAIVFVFLFATFIS